MSKLPKKIQENPNLILKNLVYLNLYLREFYDNAVSSTLIASISSNLPFHVNVHGLRSLGHAAILNFTYISLDQEKSINIRRKIVLITPSCMKNAKERK